MPASQESSAKPRRRIWWIGAILTALLAAGVGYFALRSGQSPAAEFPAPIAGKVAADVVRIEPDQLAAFDVGVPTTRVFEQVRRTLGVIDFNQDRTTKVYSAYQGRINKVLVKAGDEVEAGQVLFTVDVPDMAQASSALISSAAALRTANETLRRAQTLAQDNSIPQKELQQARSDQQSAQAAYDAARQNLLLFQLSAADVQRIEREHRINREVAVKSPIAGRVTSRAAQPGLLVQPGNDPAPITVSDLRTLWMVASVPESDFSAYHLGDPVDVRVQAWPNKIFSGRVSYLGDSVDADTRRITLRAEVADPQRQLRPQMSADFSVTVGAPQNSVAVPATAVVREGDGGDVVWTVAAKDEKGPRFARRQVSRGQAADGMVQITRGLQPNEDIARKNALFLSSLYEAEAQ